VARISWPHFQWASALILFRADAWFLANFRGNIIVFLFRSDISFTNHDLDHSLQNTVPAPQARTIIYNAVYPISALGFKSPTLAQLMARYATMDPILFSATADKRKGLSLIAPPAAKRKRISHPIFRRKPNASHMCARITISHIW
jgi:hypothetical protein